MRLGSCVLLSAFLVLSTGVSATNLTNIDGVKPSQDGKVDIYGTLDLGGNSITGLPAPASDTDAAPRRWINENDDTIPDTVIPDDQTISTNNDVSGTDDRISIDNGNSITIDDDFSPDTTVPDDQNIQVSSSGDTITVNIDNGNGGSASIQDNVADGDTDDTNELQNLEQTRSRNNNLNGNIDFQSSGSIISLENLNVNSINSNKGNDPVDLDQGIDLDGSTIVDDNDNTVNIADSLNVANNLNINGRIRVDAIEDRGTGNTIRSDSNINLNGNKITNLASPDKPSDVATKNYVDEATSSSGSTTGIKKTWIEDFDADTGTKGTIYGKQPGTTIGKNTQNLFVKTSRSTLSELEFDPFTSKKSEITVRDRQGRGRFGNEYVTFHTETVSKGSLNGVRFTVTATADGSCTTDTRIYDETNDKTIVQTGANSFNPGFESKDYTFSQNSITVTYQQANNYDCGGFRGRDFNTAWYRVPLRSSTVTIDPAYNHKINAWGTVTHYGKQEPGTSALELDVMKDGTVLEDDASPRTAFSGISPDRTPNITIRATRERINDEPSVDLIALTGFL